MTTKAEITAQQPRVPEPWLPEHMLECDTAKTDAREWTAGALTELADQLGIMNDFYYVLIGAAQMLRKPE